MTVETEPEQLFYAGCGITDGYFMEFGEAEYLADDQRAKTFMGSAQV